MATSSTDLKPLDFALLAKVLGRTGSDQDGEVLAAITAANRLLSDAGRTWADVLTAAASGGLAPVMVRPDPPVRLRNGAPLWPPYGTRWLDTILWLIQRQRGGRHDAPVDPWLAGLPVRLSRRRIKPEEALRLLAAYEIYAPRRPAA